MPISSICDHLLLHIFSVHSHVEHIQLKFSMYIIASHCLFYTSAFCSLITSTLRVKELSFSSSNYARKTLYTLH